MCNFQSADATRPPSHVIRTVVQFLSDRKLPGNIVENGKPGDHYSDRDSADYLQTPARPERDFNLKLTYVNLLRYVNLRTAVNHETAKPISRTLNT